MTHQTHAQRLADAIQPYKEVTPTMLAQASAELRRLSAIEQEYLASDLLQVQHALSVMEVMHKVAMASLAAVEQERDQLREMNDQLREQNEHVDAANAELRAQLAALKAGQAGGEVVGYRYKVPTHDGKGAWTSTKPQPEVILETQALCVATPKPVPMTVEQIEGLPVWSRFVGLWPETRKDITRAIEAHHGINASEVQG